MGVDKIRAELNKRDLRFDWFRLGNLIPNQKKWISRQTP